MGDLYHVLIEEEYLLKILVSALLGSIIGYERERAHKPAGIRTHILVSTGATLYVALSILMMDAYANTEHRMADPNRVLAQIVTGVSFLGAGTILQSRASIHGLTTAANIWVMAAIGSAVGAGYYGMAVATTIIAFVVLTMVTFFSTQLLVRRDIRSITVRSRSPIDEPMVHEVLHRYSQLVKLAEARRSPEKHYLTYRVQINDQDLPKIVADLGQVEGLTDVRAQ